MISIELLRHGHPEWAPGGTFVEDPDLSELGRAQADGERHAGHVEEAPASILEKVRRFEGHRRKGIAIMRLNLERPK